MWYLFALLGAEKDAPSALGPQVILARPRNGMVHAITRRASSGRTSYG